MDKSAYKACLQDTINEASTKTYCSNMLKSLEQYGLIHYEDHLLAEQEQSVDLTEFKTESEVVQLCKAIDRSDKVIRAIEENEFTSAYKYSVLFEIDRSPEDLIESMYKKGEIQDFHSESFTFDLLFDEASNIIVPTRYKVDDKVTIYKFNRHLTGFLPIEGNNKREIKYPILAVFFNDLNVVEIRIGKIKSFLRGDEYFYVRQFDFVVDWLQTNLACQLNPIDLTTAIGHISKLEETNVIVSGQLMNLKSGAKAKLEVGNNDDYLPLLGELKELIKTNAELFNKSLEIKEILDTFILETEETSDLPWISLTWTNETKSKATKVKFSFNYMNRQYSLLQYYYSSSTEMERMNNVTRYIIESKRQVDQQLQTNG
ncbi:hypothetical protein [Bacillus mojavensis]|uniref:hypothetical protein n=1 Tax=Bacillus mojavensis TaxID=72360 RepID=UPI00227FF5F0|nr:hypothetical protein [Bacillus mojavensis]MCY9092079.1 hypothetical protein [Bacillus mojavensis]